MRATIILPIVAGGVLLALGAWLLRPSPQSQVASQTQSSRITPAESAATQPTQAAVAQPTPAPVTLTDTNTTPDTNSPGMESGEAREQAYVENRISELMDLAMDDQPASLQTILGELTNREPQIRHAAVEAAMQFGSRDAIPKLKEAADQTDDLREKAAIAEAIEFLNLPSPAEVAALRAGAGRRPAKP